jgi:hypothetical protein
MTNDELLEAIRTGNHDLCPFCGYNDLDYGDPWPVGNEEQVINECPSCNARWRQIYTLSNAEVLREPGEPEPTEPEEGDLFTYDEIHFYELGSAGIFDVKLDRGWKVRVPLGGPWQPAVRDYMDKQKFWPSVWLIDDHGGVTLLSLEEDE